MDEHQFKQRTKSLALRVIRLIEALPPGKTSHVIGTQLLRSATSVGANYRSACRARSKADIIAKFSIVEEEADECLYWLKLLIESNLIPEAKIKSLMSETNEILSMIVASIKTLRTQTNSSSIQNPKSKI